MNVVDLYIVDSNKYSVNELASLIILNDEEKEYVYRAIADESKKERFISIYLKRKYIKEYYKNSDGKPLSKNIFFNISHSENLIVLATSKDTNIGIDIEQIKDVKEDLKRYISSDEEYKFIIDNKTFFELWTNKESLVKCIGSGIKEKPSSIVGLPINGIRKINENLYNSKTFLINDYVLSITLETSIDFEVNINKIEII